MGSGGPHRLHHQPAPRIIQPTSYGAIRASRQMAPFDAALLLCAGVLAGIVGSAGGTASLISYRALPRAGNPALAAA